MSTPQTFDKSGFCTVSGLYSESELSQIQAVLKSNQQYHTYLWEKDLCASARNFLNLATHPKIIEAIKPLLGPDIILWGGFYLERKPGDTHAWHTDIESAHPGGGFVSVWIGLEGTNKNSALKVVPSSHTFGEPLQKVIQDNGKTREETTDDDINSWTKQFNPNAKGIAQPKVTNGDAIIFDGRLWHGSDNTNTDARRTAFLFQYARADRIVKIPDFTLLSWPFTYRDSIQPPCIQISGKPNHTTNLLAEPPPQIDATLQLIAPSIAPISLETKLELDQTFLPKKLIKGYSLNTQFFEAHYSILAPGASPHALHAHIEEEILIILKGSAELHFDDGTGTITAHSFKQGHGVYYPAFHRHTIVNTSDEPVVYLMFKWFGSRAQSSAPLTLQNFQIETLSDAAKDASPISYKPLYEGPTQHLNKLHLHETTLHSGGGYEAHSDEHDVAILLLEGSVVTNGQQVDAGALIWHPAQVAHDMRNHSDTAARYLVIEFHGDNCSHNFAMFTNPKRSKKTILSKRSPQRIIKNIKRLLGIKA